MSYEINSSEYAALLNAHHYDTLKNLRIQDGKIIYYTGYIEQPIDDRIAMFEERVINKPEVKKELDRLNKKPYKL